MARGTRRKFFQGSGAGALAAKADGMAGILAGAPAHAEAAAVHWLKWNDFVPASDQLLRRQMLPEAEKALGLKINLETVNGNDLPPRVTAAIQAGTGPDLIMAFNNQTYLPKHIVIDMYAKAVQGMGAEEAVTRAEGELKKVYS